MSSGRSTSAEVGKAQAELLSILTSISKSRPAAINHQLADYIFFPLSHVLRQYSSLPVRVLEDCLGCTLVLLRTAWKRQLDPRLGIQLLILLTVLADTDSKASEPKAPQSEELQTVLFECFAENFNALAQSKEGVEALLATSNLPQLGKAIYEILNALKDGASPDIQYAALGAVGAFIPAVDDRAALATSFFPGLVSSLQKVLVPSASAPRTVKLLVTALQTLSDLLVNTLGDSYTQNLPKAEISEAGKIQPRSQLDQSWLVATSSQVKTVLATVIKLRTHPRRDVRIALCKLCFDLVGQCRNSLSESIPSLMETIVTLLAVDEDRRVSSELQTMLTLDDGLVDLLRTSLHGWLVSLPRIIQSKDDSAKVQIIKQVAASFQTLSTCGFDLSLIDRLLVDQLRDSIANLVQQSTLGKVQETSLSDAQQSTKLMIGPSSIRPTFTSVVTENPASMTDLRELNVLLQTLATAPSGVKITQGLVSSIEGLDGNAQIASFWSSLQLIRMTSEAHMDSNDFLAIQSESQVHLNDMIEELYSISLEYIDPSVFRQDRDWRLQALSLEAIALYAQQRRQDFRSELVESLYPVVHLMGSENALIRRHAMTCLNIIAAASGYTDAKDLIIANVDYLVNAVALKLNTFDISAQAPQVLLMMVKLTGPRLLPYLDDLVDSMFATLDAYHGYPKLVETIFTVLLAIAQEGAKTEQLAVTDDTHSVRRVASNRPTVKEVAQTLTSLKRKRHEDDRELEEQVTGHQEHPKRPWSRSAESAADVTKTPLESDQTDEGTAPSVPASGDHDGEVVKPPAPKTFAILLKISELTQHYLTASSPSLRTSLLALLHATFPALSKHENSFLPLTNTLWPTVVSRLEDDETYVVANALETISCICTYAGDFMRGRIVALWPELRKLAKQRAKLGVAGKRLENKIATSREGLTKSSTGSEIILQKSTVAPAKRRTAYVDAPTRMLQDAVVHVFKAIVESVNVDADIFDDLLDLAGGLLLEREDLRSAAEWYNADAVWLVLERLRSRVTPDLPILTSGEVREHSYAFAAAV